MLVNYAIGGISDVESSQDPVQWAMTWSNISQDPNVRAETPVRAISSFADLFWAAADANTCSAGVAVSNAHFTETLV